jgi:hypothetical protein
MPELARPHSMSAEIGALSALVQIECRERQEALDQFHARHGGDHLLIDKWLMLNAQCVGADAAARVEALTAHPDFKWTTPNKVYALIAGFTTGNLSGFNAADGRGYQVVALRFAPDGTIGETPFLTGFMRDEQVSGRPVDPAVGPDGALYVSDDYTGVVYRIAYGTAARGAKEERPPSKRSTDRRTLPGLSCFMPPPYRAGDPGNDPATPGHGQVSHLHDAVIAESSGSVSRLPCWRPLLPTQPERQPTVPMVLGMDCSSHSLDRCGDRTSRLMAPHHARRRCPSSVQA